MQSIISWNEQFILENTAWKYFDSNASKYKPVMYCLYSVLLHDKEFLYLIFFFVLFRFPQGNNQINMLLMGKHMLVITL